MCAQIYESDFKISGHPACKLWLNSPEGMKMGLCMDLYKFEACMWIIISVNIFSKIDFDMWALLYNFSYLNNLIFNN